ncbi:MAG: hypothetical protein ABSC01_06410 [Verrucomicrobiota bacterium]|jgi:hypothetical protein
MFNAPSLDDMVQSGKNFIEEKFLASRKTEFEKFAAKEEAGHQVTAKLKWFKEKLATTEAFDDSLVQEITLYKNADFARSIFQGAKNHMAGAHGIPMIAANFTHAFLIKVVGDEILAFSKKEVSAAKAELETFKAENSKILRELGLI